jgi:LacI family transcriptional regulator
MSLDKRPTAIFCANDETAVGAIRAITARGLRVPDDYSVAGFDNVPLTTMFIPTVTTVRQPVETIATLATRALIEMIDGKLSQPSRILPTELIVRDSTSRPKEDNP